MKVGDTEAVNIKGDVVAEAKVVEIDRDNNTVTLIVPATKVVMGLRLEIDTTPATPDESGTGHVLIGTEDVSGKTVDATTTHVESVETAAPVAETAADVTTGVEAASISGTSTGTPVGTATDTAVVPVEKPVESSE